MNSRKLILTNRVDGKISANLSMDTIEELIEFLKQDLHHSNFVSVDSTYYKEDNLDILRRLDIYNLMIFLNRVKDFSGLYSLKNLRYAYFSGLLKALDFSYFPLIEDLTYYWQKKTKNFFDLKKLKILTLHTYSSVEKNLNDFIAFDNLEFLHLIDSKINDIVALKDIKKLNRVTFSYMPNLEVNKQNNNVIFENIEDLQIYKCKRMTLDFVKYFPNLKSLSITGFGKLESIKPLLDGLPLLEYLFIGEGTDIVEKDNLYFKDYTNIKKFFFFEKRYHLLKLKDLNKWP